MADKPKSILVYSKQAPKIGYRLVTPQQQPLPTITKTPILPIMGGVNINVPNQVMPSQQRTPINLPMADRLINVPSPVAPVNDKSENKKPLEWGFKGRKPTDISYEAFYSLLEETYRGPNSALDEEEKKSQRKAQEILDKNMKKLERSAKKNKYIDKQIDRYGEEALKIVDQDFAALEKAGVPRELTGKMLGNNLGVLYLNRLTQKGTAAGSDTILKQMRQDWKTGWLRYYNELTKSQKETFDSLSDEWYGSPNDLVDVAKSL